MAQGQTAGPAGTAGDHRDPRRGNRDHRPYQDAGADELIIPDHTLGSMARKKDTCDLFMQQVAPAFR